jgi:bifunctional non-homologous end joining protein LigD
LARTISPKKKIGSITPMLAQLSDKPFDSKDWIFEIKWDGYRAVAEVNDKKVLLYSRNGLSFLEKYPVVVQELKKLKHKVILDGEIVVLNENERPDFQKLQHYEENKHFPIQYYVFDCLEVDGQQIMDLPLVERKKILKKIIPPRNSVVKYSDHIKEYGKDFFAEISSNDLEGMIAKRADSIYSPGVRTREWLKIKHHNTQEAVIMGYTAPRGGRHYFGALVLGIYENKKWKYIGHTGTGFTDKILKDVYTKLQKHIRQDSPFDTRIKVNSPVTWVDPVYVCNLKFTEVTKDGILRHPVFQGLRVDKAPKQARLDRVSA